jgi:hypothetical protein
MNDNEPNTQPDVPLDWLDTGSASPPSVKGPAERRNPGCQEQTSAPILVPKESPNLDWLPITRR